MNFTKGIHFIIASIIIWSMVLIVQITNLPILTKNLLTFCCTAPLLPISFLISKILKIQFQDKSNPLNKLGILFSVNQMIYLFLFLLFLHLDSKSYQNSRKKYKQHHPGSYFSTHLSTHSFLLRLTEL